MTQCFIALGSNLGDSLGQLESALQSIAALQHCELLVRSPWYRSAAIGPGPQPDYINGVSGVETSLQPSDLLHKLQVIERAHGRERGERWAARTLDLDILLYGDHSINEPDLQVPHPRMKDRNFVLYPLNDLAPDLTLPCGTTLESLLQSCPRNGLQLLGEACDPGR